MRIPPQIILLFSLLFFINCSDNVSGGPGGQTTNGITATVLSSIDSLALDSAKIILRPIEYLAGEELSVDTSLYICGADTFSSKDGSFEFSKILPGQYLLECLLNDSLGVIETVSIESDTSFVNLNKLYAKRVGSVSGNVDTSGFPKNALINLFIKGIEKSVIAEANGDFHIPAMAPWTYDFIVNINSGDDTITKIFSKEILSDENNKIDTVDLYAPFNPFHYLAVRVFLNNLGLFEISVDSVTDDVDGQIYKLSLYNYNISQIHTSVNKLRFLKELSFNSNSINSLPPEIGELDSLKIFRVSSNNLTGLPDEISQMSSLEEVWMIRNQLESLPLLFGDLKRLKTAEFCFNNFTSFPIGLTNLDSIEHICLDNNNIDSLPYSIGNIKSLKVLDVEANNLSSLPVSIANLTHLTKIDIDSNHVSYLPEEMMDSLVNIDSLELAYNSIDTSAYSAEFVQWLSEKSDIADWILTQD